jgi:transposase
MIRKQRKYSPEFRTQAIALAKQLGNIGEAAKKLGIPKHSLYAWSREADPERKPAQVHELTVEEQNRALRRENEELKKANYILKQAAAFFSQDHLK